MPQGQPDLMFDFVWFIHHTISAAQDDMGDICCEMAFFIKNWLKSTHI